MGPNQHSQEILIIAEYLRLKQYKCVFMSIYDKHLRNSNNRIAFSTIQVSQSVINDFSDLQVSNNVIAGLLYVPLSSGGKDFIAFLRKGQLQKVLWAGKPSKDSEGPDDATSHLEPRKSFRVWSETVTGRCRTWTDEHLETAGILALVYGKVGSASSRIIVHH